MSRSIWEFLRRLLRYMLGMSGNLLLFLQPHKALRKELYDHIRCFFQGHTREEAVLREYCFGLRILLIWQPFRRLVLVRFFQPKGCSRFRLHRPLLPLYNELPFLDETRFRVFLHHHRFHKQVPKLPGLECLNKPNSSHPQKGPDVFPKPVLNTLFQQGTMLQSSVRMSGSRLRVCCLKDSMLHCFRNSC